MTPLPATDGVRPATPPSADDVLLATAREGGTGRYPGTLAEITGEDERAALVEARVEEHRAEGRTRSAPRRHHPVSPVRAPRPTARLEEEPPWTTRSAP